MAHDLELLVRQKLLLSKVQPDLGLDVVVGDAPEQGPELAGDEVEGEAAVLLQRQLQEPALVGIKADIFSIFS